MLIEGALRQGRRHQPGQRGATWPGPSVCLSIYLFSLCSGDSLVWDDSKELQDFSIRSIYTNSAVIMGQECFLKGVQLLGLKTYVFILQTQTFQHNTTHERRHEGKKNSFLLLMEHVRPFFFFFFFFAGKEKKVLKRIKMMEIPWDQNKATTV